jgi:hypothetical protein
MTMIACDKLERNAEKATVVYFKVLFKNATVGTEEKHANLSQWRYFRCSGRDLTRAPPEYKSELVPLRMCENKIQREYKRERDNHTTRIFIICALQQRVGS